MVYTKLTVLAMQIAYAAHHRSVDKGGAPYIFHPVHLAEQMDDEVSVSVALLHDVVEDTEWTLEKLTEEGFPEEVTDALALLTHDPDVPYMDYIEKIRLNPVARKVKIADLRHNMDETRLCCLNDFQLIRERANRERYPLALTRLLED